MQRTGRARTSLDDWWNESLEFWAAHCVATALLYLMLQRLRELLALQTDPASSSTTLGTGGSGGTAGGEFAIDDYKPMKIIGIGAGMGGILAGIRYSLLILQFKPSLLSSVDFASTFKTLT